MIANLERRIAERISALRDNKEASGRLREVSDRAPADPEITAMIAEFLCVMIAGVLLLIAQPEASCALMLGAIYLKLRR